MIRPDGTPMTRYGAQRRPSRINTMTGIEAAWVGAIIEGEGSVMEKHGSLRPRWRVMVANTDPEIMSALLRLTGSGSICCTVDRKGTLGTKPVYRWELAAVEDVLHLVRQCSPYSMKLQRVPVELWRGNGYTD